MLTTLDRYVIKEVLLAFVATLVVLLAMAVTNRLAAYLSQAASGLLASSAILSLLGLQAIRFTGILAPLALLMGIMLALGRLYRDNEMTALTACGVGPREIYRPLFLIAAPLAVVLAVLSFHFLPLGMKLQLEVQTRARQEAEVSVFTPGTFREIARGEHVIYVDALTERGRQLSKVFVRTQSKDGTIAVTTGLRGHQEIDSESAVRYLVLSDGYRYEVDPDQNDHRFLSFQNLSVQVESAPIDQTRIKREAIPTAELWSSLTPSSRAELQQRLSGPVSLLLIAFTAPLLAHAHPREGRYGRLVAAILVYLIYFNLLGVGESWIARETIWPWLGLWWVHGLLLLFGASLWAYHYGFRWRRDRRVAGA